MIISLCCGTPGTDNEQLTLITKTHRSLSILDINLGFWSLCVRTSYHQTLWSLEAARLDVELIVLLWKWQAFQQRGYRYACHISERLQMLKPESHDIEASRDIAVPRRLSTLWIQGVVSLTLRELFKEISRKYTMPEITIIVRISSWKFVRVPKARLWAHIQSFSLKFS